LSNGRSDVLIQLDNLFLQEAEIIQTVVDQFPMMRAHPMSLQRCFDLRNLFLSSPLSQLCDLLRRRFSLQLSLQHELPGNPEDIRQFIA
jgi:hypothetical protein